MIINSYDKKYISGAVFMEAGRVKNTRVMPQKAIEALIVQSNFLAQAPFSWIYLSYHYVTQHNLNVLYHHIDDEYGDVLISVELDVTILQWADKYNLELLHDIYMIAALEAIIQLGEKHNLPTDLFNSERKKYGTIPATINECESYARMELT